MILGKDFTSWSIITPASAFVCMSVCAVLWWSAQDVTDETMHYQTPELLIEIKVFLWLLWKFTFAEQFLQGVPGQGATDLEPLRHNSRCDEFVVGNFFVQLVVGSLVEEHQVVELVPHFSLGPLLLRVKEGTVTDVTMLIISCSQGFLEECQSIHAFFLALPPDLLTGSLSFLDFPASFFLSCLGGCEKYTCVNTGSQDHCSYTIALMMRENH